MDCFVSLAMTRHCEEPDRATWQSIYPVIARSKQSERRGNLFKD